MILRQYLDVNPTVTASYLFGCGGKARGAVVDPTTDIARYLADSARLGLPIKYVIDTHVHADHLSGGRLLADATGAEYIMFGASETKHKFTGVADGENLDLGNVVAHVIHTPGHTPEHISLSVTDRTRGDEPWFVLTGHTLMIGDMGRTELVSDAAEGARVLFRTAQRLRELPDFVEVMPGAFSGSVCGRGLSGKTVSTIGFERRFNRAFKLASEQEFVDFMLREIPTRPTDAEEIRRQNIGVA